MKKLLIVIIIIMTGIWTLLTATDITYLEYYLDNDPGLGNANPVSITAAPEILINLDLNLANISKGLHRICYRAKDNLGKWSLIASKFIYKSDNQIAPITRLEYFIDSDPGFGNGTALSFTGSNEILCIQNINLTGIQSGFHVLHIRAQNSLGSWSLLCSKPIITYTTSIPNLVSAEVYFDQDPGYGMGISLPITYGSEFNGTLSVNTDDLHVTGGMHLMVVRCKNAAGNWSLNMGKWIYVTPSVNTQLVAIEWYFTGNGCNPNQKFRINQTSPTVEITQNIAASLVHLQQDGEYQMHIYALSQSGQKSLEEIFPFTADFSPNNVVINGQMHMVTISWDEVKGADSYKIYTKSLPNAELIDIHQTDTNYIVLPAQRSSFFSVTAVKN